MKSKKSIYFFIKGLVLIVVFNFGCATNFMSPKDTNVIQVSVGVYEIFREDYRGIFGTQSSLINEVTNDANIFAKKQGMVAIPIEARVRNISGRPADWAWFYYKFKISPIDDPEAGKSISDIVIERDFRTATVFINSKNTTSKNSVADELLKLVELKEKGNLTEEEYQRQKIKLIEQK